MWVSWDVNSYTGLELDEEEAERIYLMSPKELLNEAKELESRQRKKRMASMAYLHYARRRMEIDEWYRIEDILKVATYLNPKNSAAWFHLGIAVMMEHAYYQASQAFEKACKIQPEIVDHWTEAGVAYYFQRKWDKSKETLDRSLETKRTPRALQFLGLALVELGKERAGLGLLQEAHTLAPEEIAIQFSLGLVLFRLDRVGDAVSLLQSSIEGPKGRCKREKRRIRDALDIGRNDLGAWVVLADVFERHDRRWETIICLEMATRLMPEDAQVWYELSQVHTNYDLYEDAVHRAYELDPNDPDIICEQGQLFYDAGLKKYALDMYLEALVHNPEHEYALGKVDEIEEEFEELERDGHSPYLGEYGYNTAYDDYYD